MIEHKTKNYILHQPVNFYHDQNDNAFDGIIVRLESVDRKNNSSGDIQFGVLRRNGRIVMDYNNTCIYPPSYLVGLPSIWGFTATTNLRERIIRSCNDKYHADVFKHNLELDGSTPSVGLYED